MEDEYKGVGGKTVLQFGLGDVGTAALLFLSRSEGVDRIAVSDVNEKGRICSARFY